MNTLICLVLLLIQSIHSLSINLLDGKYIKVQVGIAELTLALDPNSNINFIFNNITKLNYSHYDSSKSPAIRKSKALLTLSYLLGEFKGNLASDLFNFNLTHDDNSIRKIEFRMNFILVKDTKDIILPQVDGIIGLGYLKNQSDFYNEMSLLYHLTNARLINRNAVHFNYRDKQIVFGKNDYEITNQTIVHMTVNEPDKIPLIYYNNLQFAFSKSKRGNLEMDREMKMKTCLMLDTYEDDRSEQELNDDKKNHIDQIIPSYLIAPMNRKSSIDEHYFNKFTVKQLKDQYHEKKNSRYLYYTFNKMDNMNFDTKTAFVFGKFYFMYNWIDNSNLKELKFPIALSQRIDHFNINLKAFRPEQVSFDYDHLQVKISNCDNCGITRGEPALVYLVLIFVVTIVGGLLFCVGFTKFVRYRKDMASQLLKQYNLI